MNLVRTVSRLRCTSSAAMRHSIGLYRHFSANQPQDHAKASVESAVSSEVYQAGPELADPSQKKSSTSKYTKWDDFRMLTKADLSVLNTVVAMAGYMLVPGAAFFSINTLVFAVATQCIAMSSQASNQIIEQNLDKHMVRTCMRPLPRNRLSNNEAKIIATALWGISNVLYFSFLPLGALVVANVTFFGYILVYTPLKRLSEINTSVGALVGALPPLLGWAAAGGALTATQPWALVLFMLAWQYPHFYGILWTYRRDYDNLGYKMIKDHKRAAVYMRIAILGMAAASGMLQLTGDFSWIGSALMAYSLYKGSWKSVDKFEQDPSTSNAKMLKRGVYLPFTIFFLTILLKILGLTPEEIYSKLRKADPK